MKKEQFDAMDGIDRLRGAASYFNWCNESFNQRYTAEELLKIYAVGMVCGWDVYPDQWTRQQCEAAIKEGKLPKFEEVSDGPIGLHALEVTDCYCQSCRRKRDEEEQAAMDDIPEDDKGIDDGATQ